jgi:hypothetical protein
MSIKGLSPSSAAAVRNKALQNESGGVYNKPANNLGFIGGYQFGTAALQDLGYVKPGTFDPKLSVSQNNAKLNNPNNWTIAGGKDAFLNNPQLQDRAFDRYATQNINTLTRLGVITPNTPEADIAGYAMASHIGGAGGARALVNGEIREDANGTSTAKYFKDGKTAALQSQSSPTTLTSSDASLSSLPTEQISRGNVQSVRAPDQASAAATYGTKIGSQQTLLLAEQDSWFASTNGKGVPGQTATPIPNPLSKFTSFSYLITLGCLAPEQVDVMDGYGSIVLQSANGLPLNRQQIASGSWDFYINELDIESLVGFERMSKGTNVTRIDFEVVEPYSLGLFLESLQVAALVVGNNNYSEAAFCLSIEFVGWDDNGVATRLDDDVRRVALRFTNIEMDISTKGSRYKVQAIPWSEYALTDQVSKLQSDVNFYCNHNGPFTVKDLLKTAEASLENVINLRFKELQEKANNSLTPDSIEIKFEPTAEDIANSEVSFDLQQGGVAGNLKAEDVYATNSVNRKLVNHNPNSKGFTFKQGNTIVTAITETLLQSKYCTDNIRAKIENPVGMVDWFRIETEVKISGNEDGRNRPPRTFIYKIVKYKVHASRLAHPSSKPDYNSLLSNVVKVYDYLYTGKNTEVLDFNINIKYGFFNTVYADYNQYISDILYQQQIQGAGMVEHDVLLTATNPSGPSPAETGLPETSTGQNLRNRFDPGGSGAMTMLKAISKSFHEALLDSPEEMVIAEFEVMGDPYYLIGSGTGNVSFSNYDGSNITANGEMDYQSGEVDVLVNFRTPVDIDDKTGIVDFASTEVAQGFSGLYHVIRVENKFRQGKFTQKIHAVRRPKQAKGGSALAAISQNAKADIPTSPDTSKPAPQDPNTLGTSPADTIGAFE